MSIFHCIVATDQSGPAVLHPNCIQHGLLHAWSQDVSALLDQPT